MNFLIADLLSSQLTSRAVERWCLDTREMVIAEAQRELSATLGSSDPADQSAVLLTYAEPSVLKTRLCSGAWLETLSSHINLLARGELPERPDPQFIEEVTPRRSQTLEPLIARMSMCRDSLELESAIVQGLSEIGSLGLLLLLGQRRTSASLSSALGFPPDHETLYRSFEREHSAGKTISVGGRAFTKHAARSDDPWWGHPKGNDQAKNQHARRVLSQILDNPTWWNTFYHYKQGVVFEAREPQGHGARWADQGQRFIGFLEPFDETLGGTSRRVTEGE